MKITQAENQALLRGFAAATPEHSHTVHGIAFYSFPLRVPRLSGNDDLLNIVASETLLQCCPVTPDAALEVLGEIRSFNNRSGAGSRLVITLYAKELRFTQEEPCNQVLLSGVICKAPILRRTPLGRDICDILLAVNRRYRRADYLPCIAWGSLAAACAQMEVGEGIRLEGRLQSRVYTKRVDNESTEHTAYEISIMSLPDEETEPLRPLE